MAEGLLLINLGSPNTPTRSAVRRYLREFLMDRRVLDNHWMVRSLLVHGLIAPLRAKRSAHAYQSIWTEHGSPLIRATTEFAESVESLAPGVHVEMAMRYGHPTIASAISRLVKAGVQTVLVVPLYPQFAKSSSLTAMEAVLQAKKKFSFRGELRFLQDFYDRPEWIDSLAANIREQNESFNGDFLLLSYHGLPEHHIQELDKTKSHCLVRADCCESPSEANRLCYRAQCYATSRALLKAASWPGDRAMVSFQSRLGRRPWIQPFSDHVILDLAKQGKKRVLVTCPSFVCDCLETLEEVGIRMRQDFLAAGGENLRLVPALNGSIEWAKLFLSMLESQDLPWLREADVASILERKI